MIIKRLITHQWLSSVRAPGYYKNLTVTIFVALFALYMAVAFFILGFMLPMGFEKDPIAGMTGADMFNGALLYLTILGLATRFFIQPLTTLNLDMYQTLPIKRSAFVNYVLLKPLFNPVNFFMLFFIIPYAIRAYAPNYSGGAAFRFVLICILLIMCNILLVSYLKRRFGSSLWTLLGIIVLLGALVLCEYFKIFSLFDVSRSVFDFLVRQPYGVLIAALIPFGAYWLNRQFFSANYYSESFNKRLVSKQTYAGDFTFMKRFGQMGELISLRLKVILRHKRTKSTLIMGFVFLFYGFFYSSYQERMSGQIYLIALLITGSFMLMFAGWLYSLDSSFFDFLMTRNIKINTYIRSYYLLLLSLTILSFILTTPYFFIFGKKIFYVQLSAFIYNIGVNLYCFLFFGVYNAKKLDLSKRSAMNYQGVSYKNFLILIPVMIFPMLVIAIFPSNVDIIVLGVIGLLGLALHSQWMKMTEKFLLKRKYRMCEEFRKNI